MQTGKWGERETLCCCCVPSAVFCVYFVYMYEWVFVCVSHRNPTLLQMTPGIEKRHLSLRHRPDRHPLCASNNMNMFVCVCNVRLYPWWRVQGYQLFLKWSGSITSHPGLCLCVIPLIALLLDILKWTLKPKSTLMVCPLLFSLILLLSLLSRAGTSFADSFFKLMDNL